MTLFPHTRWGRIRTGVIVLVLLVVCEYRNVFALAKLASYQPRDGDIVFQSLPHNDLVDAIEGVSRSTWSHCGVIIRKNNSWMVAEAIGTVRETPLALWIVRGRKGVFEAYRVTAPEANDPAKLHRALTQYLGRPYDFHYAPGDTEIYCSELVHLAYHDAYGLNLGVWQQLGTLNWQPHEAFLRAMESGALPLSREMITPVGITRSPLVKRVFPEAATAR